MFHETIVHVILTRGEELHQAETLDALCLSRTTGNGQS
jgi:hypothetical protein